MARFVEDNIEIESLIRLQSDGILAEISQKVWQVRIELLYLQTKWIDMLVLQDCIQKLSDFKVAFAQKFGILKLGIFGSVARNENTENSDIDIVVEVQKPSLQLMYELREALKQLFGCEVDLVRFRDSLRPLFKSNIQKDVIYV